MKITEYTVEQIIKLMNELSGMYDLVRVVDPAECRVISLNDDGTVSLGESCYSIWGSEEQCDKCSSAIACRTGSHQEKTERYQGKIYHIQSNPIFLKPADGQAFNAVMELVSIEDAKGYEGEYNDKDDENRDHKAAEYRASHDDLTGALTPTAFNEAVRKKILNDPDREWVMINANIMDFRLINALFGVRRGNDVLVNTADLLRGITDKAGGICGRVGGDKFTLFLPKDCYKEEDLIGVEDKLSDKYSSGLYTFIIHFGVYFIDSISVPVSVMSDRANAAMRTMRGDINETVAYFDDSIMRQSLFAQEVVSGFDEALEEKQFKMYLQPLAEKDGTIYGAEALVRWVRPDGTVVMPGDFIETLEKVGLIYKLDMYMWECAVKQLSEWKNTDKKNVTISVNMSAKDFYSIDVYQTLTDLVEKYDVEPRLLRVEITETALLRDTKKSNVIISRMRDRGFLIEIDDFGKGYSSLNMLKDIQADVLKIDMSLLREIESKERSRVILESVVDMAGALQMDIITEGVETEGQLKSLLDMGCTHFQGFYFYRPIPVQEFETKYEDIKQK